MSDTLHLLVPYAASHHPGCQHTLQTLALPHLDGLLRQLQRQGSDSGDEDHPAMPHERALARALGLPGDGAHTPWAAWQVQRQGPPPEHPPAQTADTSAWAFVTPCHWQVGTDHITLIDPHELALDEAASRALLAIVAPWLQSDGITLVYEQPTRWLARGDALAHLVTPSLERAQGHDVRGWLQHQAQTSGQHSPQVQAAQTWQRLHSELQMLLYTHPFNDARTAQGLPAVNSFWVHGTGALPAGLTAPTQPPQVADALRAPALREDWRAWASTWTALDAGPVAELLRQAEQGQPVRLTLSGEHCAQTFHTAPLGLVQRIQRFLKPQRFMDVREQL